MRKKAARKLISVKEVNEQDRDSLFFYFLFFSNIYTTYTFGYDVTMVYEQQKSEQSERTERVKEREEIEERKKQNKSDLKKLYFTFPKRSRSEEKKCGKKWNKITKKKCKRRKKKIVFCRRAPKRRHRRVSLLLLWRNLNPLCTSKHNHNGEKSRKSTKRQEENKKMKTRISFQFQFHILFRLPDTPCCIAMTMIYFNLYATWWKFS